LAQPAIPNTDATKVWPDNWPTIELAEIAVSKALDTKMVQNDVFFMPTNVTSGPERSGSAESSGNKIGTWPKKPFNASTPPPRSGRNKKKRLRHGSKTANRPRFPLSQTKSPTHIARFFPQNGPVE
jgi:hypothetical protein